MSLPDAQVVHHTTGIQYNTIQYTLLSPWGKGREHWFREHTAGCVKAHTHTGGGILPDSLVLWMKTKASAVMTDLPDGNIPGPLYNTALVWFISGGAEEFNWHATTQEQRFGFCCYRHPSSCSSAGTPTLPVWDFNQVHLILILIFRFHPSARCTKTLSITAKSTTGRSSSVFRRKGNLFLLVKKDLCSYFVYCRIG